MFCPEHRVFDSRYLRIWHYQIGDVPREYVTWREVLNPLRYEIILGKAGGRRFVINEHARLNRKVSNFIWGLRHP